MSQGALCSVWVHPGFARPIATARLRAASVWLEALEPRRLLNAGDLDPSFGDGGTVAADRNGSMFAYEAAVQADGKIVVAGSTFRTLGTDDDLALARYNADGTLDTTFGSDGIVVADFPCWSCAGLAIVEGGKILALGRTTHFEGGRVPNYDFALARFNPDGGLDATFGQGGKVITDLGGSEVIDSFAAQADGKILVVGCSTTDFSCHILVRYDIDGRLDTTYGDRGIVLVDSQEDGCESTAIQSDGKLVLAGTHHDLSTGDMDAYVARYNADGTPDTSFGENGKFITNSGDEYASVYGVAVQADGRILTTGRGLMRYTSDGRLDLSFGDHAGLRAPSGAVSLVWVSIRFRWRTVSFC